MKDGVIADSTYTEKMLNNFIGKVHGNRWLRPSPRVLICVPFGSTQVERRAIQESPRAPARAAWTSSREPMAAAVGAGLPVNEARGSMVLDIGGGTSEVAVISLNGIVYAESVRVGGDRFDEAITNYVRRNYGILIGEATAERIKIEIGSAYPGQQVRELSVKGRNLSEGVPRSFTLNSNETLDKRCRNRCRASSRRSRRRSSTPPRARRRRCGTRHRTDRRRRAPEGHRQAPDGGNRAAGRDRRGPDDLRRPRRRPHPRIVRGASGAVRPRLEAPLTTHEPDSRPLLLGGPALGLRLIVLAHPVGRADGRRPSPAPPGRDPRLDVGRGLPVPVGRAGAARRLDRDPRVFRLPRRIEADNVRLASDNLVLRLKLMRFDSLEQENQRLRAARESSSRVVQRTAGRRDRARRPRPVPPARAGNKGSRTASSVARRRSTPMASWPGHPSRPGVGRRSS